MDEPNYYAVTWDAREWLRGFMTKVNTQNNRATACPYYYDLRYKRDGEEEKRVEYSTSIFFTEEAAKQYIVDNAHNLPEGVYTYLCWGGRNHEMRDLLSSIGELVGVPYIRR